MPILHCHDAREETIDIFTFTPEGPPVEVGAGEPDPGPFDRHVAQTLDDPRHDAVDVDADTREVDLTQVDAKRFHRFY